MAASFLTTLASPQQAAPEPEERRDGEQRAAGGIARRRRVDDEQDGHERAHEREDAPRDLGVDVAPGRCVAELGVVGGLGGTWTVSRK